MIETFELTKTYRRVGKRFDALHKVSVTLPDGITALIGPNGSGKSTLMRLLVGLEKPSSGHFLLDGVKVDRAFLDGYRKRIGYVPQDVHFVPRMTLEESLEYAGWIAGMNKKDYSTRKFEALELVNLQEQSQQRVGSLSGGQNRRLGIAAALMHQPATVFLDEPTAGLDPSARVALRRIVKNIGQEATVVISTHIADDVTELSDHVIALHNGIVSFEGTWPALRALAADYAGKRTAADPLELALNFTSRGEQK